MISFQADNSCGNSHYHYDIYQNYRYMPHFHQYYEVACTLEGEVVLTVNERTEIIHKGEMAFILPNQIHSFYSAVPSRIWISLFSADLVAAFAQTVQGKTTDHSVFVCSERCRGLIEDNMLVADEDPLFLKAFLYAICSEFSYATVLVEQQKPEDTIPIYRILLYISEHFRENITLKDLSLRFGYNTNYLSRFFNQVTKTNFKAFLNEYRISYAKTQLLQTEKLISVIALESGFDSIRNFNRAFYESAQTTPSGFRVFPTSSMYSSKSSSVIHLDKQR
jgi:AraC-like DNA-binding protein